MTLFIVDDSELLRQRIRSLVADIEGMVVVGSAVGVTEALVVIEQQRPDAVILDLRLADGSGIDVLDDLKTMDPPPLIIVFTNYSTPQYRRICLERGADYFLGKSEEFEKIETILRQLIPSFPPGN
jgi:DNA-binding NarL/FixJ family response regulator